MLRVSKALTFKTNLKKDTVKLSTEDFCGHLGLVKATKKIFTSKRHLMMSIGDADVYYMDRTLG